MTCAGLQFISASIVVATDKSFAQRVQWRVMIIVYNSANIAINSSQ